MDASVNPAFCVSAEIRFFRRFLVLCNMYSMLYQLVNSFAFRGRDGNYRNSQIGFHLVYQNSPSIFPQFIHHVERHHHRHLKLQKLHCQIQIPLNIGGVYNVNNSPWPLLQ